MGITRLISNMLEPTASVKKAAESMGIQFNATALQTQGLDGVLRSVYAATGGNAEKNEGIIRQCPRFDGSRRSGC